MQVSAVVSALRPCDYYCVVTQKGLVLFSLAGIFWGLPYFFIALALESFSTPSIVFLRTFLGALELIYPFDTRTHDVNREIDNTRTRATQSLPA